MRLEAIFRIVGSIGLSVWLGLAAPASAQCINIAVAGGTADALTVQRLSCTPTSSLMVLTTPLTTTSTAPTISENGATPRVILSSIGGPLAAGALLAGGQNLLTFNGTNWFLLNFTGGTIISSNTPVVLKAATNVAMKALTMASTGNNVIRRVGFTTEADGPPLDFDWHTGSCAARTLSNDGASCVDANDGNSLSGIFPGFVDVHWFGAHDDAVPGAVGTACSGITGTDNQPFFTAAYAYALANRIDLYAGGSGMYRLNSKWTLTGFASPQPWNSNTQNPVQVTVTAPMVTCGNDAGVLVQTNESYGLKAHFARLIGPGAANSAPTPYAGAENIGVQISGTSQEDIYVGMVSDYTYDILLENSFSNRLTIGLLQSAYKSLYLRNGACGAACSTQDNIINYQTIGGVYTFNGDPNFATRQARSSYWGVHIEGAGTGNVLTGGVIEYNLKGTAGVNLQVDSDHNYITTWLEGNNGVNGKNLVVGGSYNSFWLSNLASPSSGMTTNVSVSGVGNNLFGPVIGDPIDVTWGAININGTNFINNNPVGVNAGGLTFNCDVGAPVNITGTARYKKTGSQIYYEATITTTNIGTCAGALNITNLPAPTSPTRKDIMSGWNNAGIGLWCLATPGTTSLQIVQAGGAFPAVNGQTLQCSGWYNAE